MGRGKWRMRISSVALVSPASSSRLIRHCVESGYDTVGSVRHTKSRGRSVTTTSLTWLQPTRPRWLRPLKRTPGLASEAPSSHSHPSDSPLHCPPRVASATTSQMTSGGAAIQLLPAPLSAAEAFAEAAKEPDERQAYTVSRGISHQLRLGFVSGQELWGALLLFRGHGSLAFTREERELLGRLGPRLGAGLRAAVLRRQVTTDADEPGMPGILVLDRRGRVAQYTMAAERWLQELAELPADWRDGEGMPAAVYLAIGALRSALHGMRGRTTHIDARTRTGGWLRLQATLTEGERDAEVMIVIEPLQSRDLVWLRTAVYNLTKREQEVVDLVMRGSSNCRIAETLFISEYTVQDHLSHILDKVGVCTRRALVKQLYLGGGP